MTTIDMYRHSLRYLRPVQISGRIRLAVRRKLLYRLSPTGFGNYVNDHVSHQVVRVASPNPATEGRHQYNLNTFTFLNRTVNLGEPIDWFPGEASQLWKYNLHYFDYVSDLAISHICKADSQAFATFRSLVQSWMDSVPLATHLAWDPYPTSLRIVNWIKALYWFGEPLRDDPDFVERVSTSIFNQALFLGQNIEYHLLGNHLLENGRALLFAGRFLEGNLANKWTTKAIKILDDGLEEQFLADGGHYERSPMYHLIMLHLYQDVLDVLGDQQPALSARILQKLNEMQCWLANMIHPDGEIALFNDAAFGIAGNPCNAVHGVKVKDGLHMLEASGYYIFRDQVRGQCLIFDAGAIGPDYQPGHGHCDTLSYELSLNHQRIIVDSGVGNYYGDEKFRQYYRSTRAHNAVVIDHQDQSEVWGRFRVARRAYPRDVVTSDHDRLQYVIASHTGYQRLSGRPEHRRWLAWVDKRFWIVCDRVSSKQTHMVESYVHLHPEVTLEKQSDPGMGNNGRYAISRGEVRAQILPWGVDSVAEVSGCQEPLQGWYAPEFGIDLPSTVICLTRQSDEASWFGYLIVPDLVSANVVSVKSAASMCTVTVSCGSDTYVIHCADNEIRLEC